MYPNLSFYEFVKKIPNILPSKTSFFVSKNGLTSYPFCKYDQNFPFSMTIMLMSGNNWTKIYCFFQSINATSSQNGIAIPIPYINDGTPSHLSCLNFPPLIEFMDLLTKLALISKAKLQLSYSGYQNKWNVEIYKSENKLQRFGYQWPKND